MNTEELLHVRNTAKEWCRKLNKSGFGGVQIQANVEGDEEPIEGEQTVEEAAAWHRDYACVIVVAYFEIAMFGVNSDYVSFDESGFWRDFYKDLKETFGDGVNFKHRKGCQEFEISRRSLEATKEL